MYVGLKQPRGDGERYVTPARAAAKETIYIPACRRATCSKSTFSHGSNRLRALHCDAYLSNNSKINSAR